MVLVHGLVIVRRGNDAGDIAVVIGENAFEHLNVVEWNRDDVLNIFIENSRITDIEHPREDAVIAADKFDDLLSTGRGSRRQHREVRDVASILREHRPIGAVNRVNEKFGQLDHAMGRNRGAVCFFHLGSCGGVYFGVIVTQDVRAVSAHIIDKTVAIDIPEMCPFRSFTEDRIRRHGDKTAGRRPQMPRHTGGNDLCRSIEQLSTFRVLM